MFSLIMKLGFPHLSSWWAVVATTTTAAAAAAIEKCEEEETFRFMIFRLTWWFSFAARARSSWFMDIEWEPNRGNIEMVARPNECFLSFWLAPLFLSIESLKTTILECLKEGSANLFPLTLEFLTNGSPKRFASPFRCFPVYWSQMNFMPN